MALVVTTYEPLTDVELRLVRRLRDVHDGVARDHLLQLIDDLVNFTGDPRCPHAQADGVPCASVGSACEQCQSVTDTLVGLRGRLLRVN
jgi:hypothetical protein